MKTSSIFGGVAVLCVLLVIAFCAGSQNSRVEMEQEAYSILPDAAKARVETLKADLAGAKSGDFLVLKGGQAREISQGGVKSPNGARVWVRMNRSSAASAITFMNWAIHRDIDRVVAKSDPEWCLIAMKYLQ